MSKRTPEQAAILVALLLKRSGHRRARISENTIRLLSKRHTLRDAFKSRLTAELDDLGIHLVELQRGGFGAIFVSALDGAPSITTKRVMPEEMKKLKTATEELFARYRDEVDADAENGDESE